jgi:hypothetical protein
MFYDIVIDVSGRQRIKYEKSTKIGVQNIFESFLADGSDFTFAVKEHIHNHLWYSDERDSNGDVNFVCENCDETFKLSQTVLTACHAGEAAAMEHGF